MPRTVPANLATILAGPRMIDHTLTLTFPDASVMRFATSPLTIGGNDYSNDLENVRELRQTLDAAPDRVGVELQNEDRVLSVHLASNWQKWRICEAVVGRYYRGGLGFATAQWVEMFRGGVQQPKADDRQLTFDILHDALTPGAIVSNGTLNPLCQNVFKDPTTCGYAGSETSCDHHLRSTTGCDGLGNSHRFRGMEHRYNPDASAPGSGGNIGGGYCVRSDQFIKTRSGVKLAGFITESDQLWNPIRRQFFDVRSVRLIPDQPIWELVTSNGAVGYSTPTHPVICHRAHLTGAAVSRFEPDDTIVTEAGGLLNDFSFVLISRSTGQRADVVLIEIDSNEQGDKIFAYGDSFDSGKFIVCHNAKQVGTLEV